MTIRKCLVIVILSGCFFMIGLIHASAREQNLAPLLDNITERMNSYNDKRNWKYRLVTKSIEMDKQWKPKKTTITTVVIKDVDNIISGEILAVVETEDGITRDITQEMTKQAEKQIEDANKARSEQKDQKTDEYDSLFPFNDSKKARFEFKRLDDTTFNERPVFIIEAVAKEKDEQLFEGEFYIDQKTYDILKARISPSRNPKFVKELDMDLEFEVFPGENFIRTKSRTRVNGGILFKSYRMILEEEYSDIEILE